MRWKGLHLGRGFTWTGFIYTDTTIYATRGDGGDEKGQGDSGGWIWRLQAHTSKMVVKGVGTGTI
jgi:hypothetical protein